MCIILLGRKLARAEKLRNFVSLPKNYQVGNVRTFSTFRAGGVKILVGALQGPVCVKMGKHYCCGRVEK